MAFFYDFHIHSCLSPCADNDMTPGNVCGMARLKGLDAIAITDHNTARNLRAFSVAAKRHRLLLLPAMELCSQEEVHILAYFPTVDAAEEMGAHCLRLLAGKRNRPDFYGEQTVVNDRDEPTGTEGALLIGSLDIALHDLNALVRSLGGVPVPAHIARGNGLVTMLGFIPPGDNYRTVEAPLGTVPHDTYRVLHSSDAHQLGAISEAEHALPCEATVLAILDWMRGDTNPVA